MGHSPLPWLVARGCSASEEPSEEALGGRLLRGGAGASVALGNASKNFVLVLAAAGPGRLLAGPAGGLSTHGR
jgi:hypothetical protein